jgi:hypothetical protein
MAYRVLIWAVVGVLIVAAAAVIADLDFIWERREGPIFIASNGPISEDEVRRKLMTEGWTNVLVKQEGRFYRVMGVKDQKTSHLIVDSQTGRLRRSDDDDD